MSAKYFLYFAAFRIANVFLIQSQFDPDEYWQNLEPSYCRIFGEDQTFDEGSSCPGLTWEWKRRQKPTGSSNTNEYWSQSFIDVLTFGLEGPVRSFASILPTLIFYAAIKRFRLDSSWMVSRGPLIVNAVLVAALADWCVWYSSRWMRCIKQGTSDSNPKKESRHSIVFWCVYCSLSSWFNAYALVRTYSNSLETALLAVSFALVSPVFLSTGDSTIVSKYSNIRAWIAFFIGGICVSIRFTCLTAYIPMGIILACQKTTTKGAVTYLFGICAFGGILGFLSTILLDRVMFGVWAIPVLGNFHFNVIQGNGSLYGTHPFHWYFTAGLPALTGILFPVLVYDFFFGLRNRATRNLWAMIACYVIAHSGSDHKEFRFLLPILPMICLLCGTRIHELAKSFEPTQTKKAIIACAGANLIAIFYLGLFHQRAPIEVNRAILRAVASAPKSPHDSVHVHYLMGCHSTPLLSHLHDPPTSFEPWYLDCSPRCRADSNIECESDLFSKAPADFIQHTYFGCDIADASQDDTCTATADGYRSFKSRQVPDYVVCYSDELKQMQPQFELMGMEEIGRFVHGINGIRIGNVAQNRESLTTTESTHTKFLPNPVAFSYEEMVLLHRIR